MARSASILLGLAICGCGVMSGKKAAEKVSTQPVPSPAQPTEQATVTATATSTEVGTDPGGDGPCVYDQHPDGTVRDGWQNCTQEEIDEKNAQAIAKAAANKQEESVPPKEDEAVHEEAKQRQEGDEAEDQYVTNAMYSIKIGQTLSSMLPEAKEIILAKGVCTPTSGGDQICRIAKDGHYSFRVEFREGAVFGVFDVLEDEWVED